MSKGKAALTVGGSYVAGGVSAWAVDLASFGMMHASFFEGGLFAGIFGLGLYKFGKWGAKDDKPVTSPPQQALEQAKAGVSAKFWQGAARMMGKA